MRNTIPYTSFSGVSEQICAQGNAVEFIQPWYSPISTTPSNTGMAIGGIGSTFTLTPLGNTPSFSFIPGIYIDNNDNQFNLNDFFVSVADEISTEHLVIADFAKLSQFIHFYPALFQGRTLDLTSSDTALTAIKNAANSGGFYADNAEYFTKWRIEFTSKTQAAIKQDARSIDTQLLVMLDFFNGHVINKTAKSKSLTADSNLKSIEAIAATDIEYQALYPIAEYRYSAFEEISIQRKVVSPIVRGDKKLCSLPMHWNEFEVTNLTKQVKTVTIVQSLKNLIGSTYAKQRPGVQDSACVLTQNPIKQSHSNYTAQITDDGFFSGVLLATESPYQSDIEGEVLFGVQVDSSLVSSQNITVSTKPTVYSVNEQDAVIDALNSGRVNSAFDTGIYSGREAMSALVVVQLELQPNQSLNVRFVQVMDHSKILLQDWQSEKAYAQFYSQDNRAVTILQDNLADLDSIEQQIIAQQQRYFEQAKQAIGDNRSAVNFSTMAMNTLSFLAESTVWDIEDKFLVKECVDYPFFNSLDVYFYGSFSLLYLLPELDGCVMKAFSEAILAQDPTKRRFWEYEDKPNAELIDSKYQGVRAIRGAVIHDLGSPFDIKPDAYTWHNVKEWKDLAPKYVLMVYRHYKQTGDLSVVESCWQAVKESVDYLVDLIEEGDALPLTRGTDDTFDNLASHGISVYCASLWVAGLHAASELAKLMDETNLADGYSERANASLMVLERGLWDEEKGYFHFYVTPVQAKHLTGQNYQPLTSIGLLLTGNTIVDKEIVNDYLDQVPQTDGQSKVEARRAAKKQLLQLAPKAFTDAYGAIIDMDSDNSFGDALLADSYLKLLGMNGLFSEKKVSRALDYVYQTNFKVNSPKLGVANMTLANGLPHEAFQAQDVWIGVQFSVASALRLAGKNDQAIELMDTVYDALYHQSKIPFAAPEGFNCSVIVSVQALCDQFDIDEDMAKKWHARLIETECLLNDCRVNPYISDDISVFSNQVDTVIDGKFIAKLHVWLQNTGLKYTAGRYFRPGMIFSYLPEAL
ncbi:GH116 family glycosyl hydrolase [Vibrio sp. TH_r3]|uniref:GH116 family glycosyl hydrolase n=1 Tax=Vibrio sp. TH_r3 TaxID=3082084 RepID=UPI0029540CC8|nr:GH116 family glycosyl hydrolase [Vibrio sp. TH_r3]MDV7103054.1 GH116 family glycosyl hydrolase [Vibrio sp. TH_r3]